MKKGIAALLCVLMLSVPVLAVGEPWPETSAGAACVMHVETGAAVYEDNADTPMLIASTTKIMTALVVLEHCTLSEPVEILPEDTNIEGSSMYLRAGDVYTVEELLYGLMLASGNDAAVALARHTAGSIEAFADLMNAKAAELELTNSHFVNPHGLDAEGHHSTARELAKLTCAAMQNEAFRRIVSTSGITIGDKTFTNHNKLLKRYDGCIGVKTGYTEAAGRILVSCAERDGTAFVCVTISDPDDWDDHEALLDQAFAAYKYERIEAAEYAVPVLSGTAASCIVNLQKPMAMLLKVGQAPTLQAELPPFVFAPVRAGDALGSLTVTAPDGATVRIPLICTEQVDEDADAALTASERLTRLWRLLGHALFSYYPDN